MRTIDGQLEEILLRADRIRKRRVAVRRAAGSGLTAVFCLAALIGMPLYLPRLAAAESAAAGSDYGSLILTAPHMVYIVVGILAFALGISVTLLSLSLIKLHRSERAGK